MGDIDQRDGLGRTPLHLACQDADGRRVKKLLDQGAFPDLADSVGLTPLHLAVRHRNLEAVRALIAKGASVDAREKKHGATPLHLAVSGSDLNLGLVRVLLEAGAPVNALDFAGWAPLWFAFMQRDEELVRLLATHGADLNKPNPGGIWPLDAATKDPLMRKLGEVLEELGARRAPNTSRPRRLSRVSKVSRTTKK
jgi:ankyrin repeat protein